jgi:hypothetical protein
MYMPATVTTMTASSGMTLTILASSWVRLAAALDGTALP